MNQEESKGDEGEWFNIHQQKQQGEDGPKISMIENQSPVSYVEVKQSPDIQMKGNFDEEDEEQAIDMPVIEEDSD